MLASPASSPTTSDAQVTDDVILAFNLPHSIVRMRALRDTDNLALEWHGGPDLRSFYERQWWAHESEEAFVLVADFNGFPIGQAAIYWQGKPTHPHWPDLQSLRVHPIFQGQGIGTRLLEAASLVVQSRKIPHLSLSVSVVNHGAHRLYERCGFRVSSEPYEATWDYINAAGETVHLTETIVDLLKEL